MTSFTPTRRVVSWGRVTRSEHAVAQPAFRDMVPSLVSEPPPVPALAFGLGRSYGDSNLNSGGRLIEMSRLDRVIAFDRDRGVLAAEAGLSISDALKLVVPKGWFLSTTPGTRFVTLGGAIANDVHGKNHHRAGSFGRAVRKLTLVTSDGRSSELSRDGDSELFAATIGGLGLTGAITTVELDLARIPSADLEVESIPFATTDEFFSLAQDSADAFEHTVAWIDCANTGTTLGRGIFQRANWASDGSRSAHHDKTRLAMPADAPSFLLNGLSVRAFNALYYRLQARRAGKTRMHYAPFFYPLDAIRGWNRLYGRRGFYQYQCVVPPFSARDAIRDLIRQIAQRKAGSFLGVLKTFGDVASPGLLSFPREGATLALDFPNKGPATLDLLARLDAIVAEAGGRLYPAKDGRMPAEMFRRGYPELPRFVRHVDPGFSSDFWRRVSA